MTSLTEKIKELEGEINQIRIHITEKEQKTSEAKSSILANLLYPILVALVIFFIGTLFKSCDPIDNFIEIKPHTMQQQQLQHNPKTD